MKNCKEISRDEHIKLHFVKEACIKILCFQMLKTYKLYGKKYEEHVSCNKDPELHFTP